MARVRQAPGAAGEAEDVLRHHPIVAVIRELLLLASLRGTGRGDVDQSIFRIISVDQVRIRGLVATAVVGETAVLINTVERAESRAIAHAVIGIAIAVCAIAGAGETIGLRAAVAIVPSISNV